MGDASKTLYWYARKFGLRHEDAEEIVQEFLLKKHLDGNKYIDVKFFLIDQLRKRSYTKSPKYHGIGLYDDLNELDKIPSATLKVKSVPTERELEDALRHFDTETRIIVILFFYWGFTMSEIGFVLGGNKVHTTRKIRSTLEKELGIKFVYRTHEKEEEDGREGTEADETPDPTR